MFSTVLPILRLSLGTSTQVWRGMKTTVSSVHHMLCSWEELRLSKWRSVTRSIAVRILSEISGSSITAESAVPRRPI